MKRNFFSALLALFASACMTGPYDGQVVDPNASGSLRFAGYLEQPSAEVQLLVRDLRGEWIPIPTSRIVSLATATPWGGSTWHAWSVHVPYSTLRPYWRSEGLAGRRLYVKARTRPRSTASWTDVYSFDQNIADRSSPCYLLASGRTAAQLQPCLSPVTPVARLQDAAFTTCGTTDTTCNGRDDDCNGVVDDRCSEPPGPNILIPRSDTCNEGVTGCVTVPPRRAPNVDIDGVRGAAEYWGAVEVPFVTSVAPGGRLYLSVDENRNLLAFAESASFSINSFEVAVHLDFDRWAAAPDTLRDSDRRLVVNVETGATRVERPVTSAGRTRWEPTSGSGYRAAISCVALGDLRECDLEMAVPLPASAFAPPAPGLLPGVGFAFGDYLAEVMVPYASTATAPFWENYLSRSRYTSILFGQPEGVPFTFISWNVARWGDGLESSLTDTPFADVDLHEIAEVLWSYDVVAVQEMWERNDATALLEIVNARRAEHGLAPFQLSGPAMPPPNFIQANGGGLRGDYQAGLFVMTRFPILGEDHIIYDDCRGEDCLKPKGAQWVRIGLNQPQDLDRPECRQPIPNPGLNCPSTPTSEMYVDVFNTHLQAKDPVMCQLSDAELAGLIHVAIGECVGLPRPAVCTAIFTALQASAAYCNRLSSPEVTRRQLAQLADFVERVAAGNRGQPALLAGDFNIDGRRLRDDAGEVWDPTYVSLLSELGLRPVGSGDVFDDAISPHADLFDWDIDHGDVAREEAQYDWERCGHGTSIGKNLEDRYPDWTADGETFDARGCRRWNCDSAGSSEGHKFDKRLDYFLVRPSTRPEEPTASPGYMLSRSHAPVWSPLWPATTQHAPAHLCGTPDGTYGQPRISGQDFSNYPRISDHRPIVGHFVLTPLRVPPPFDAHRVRELEVRVVSVDAKGTHDCWRDMCSPLDLFVVVEGWRVPYGSTTREAAPGSLTRRTCEGWSISVGDDECIDDWALVSRRLGAERNEVMVRLFDEDLAGGEDALPTVAPGRNPMVVADWRTGTWDLRVEGLDVAPAGWEGPVPFLSSDPVCQQTREGRPNMVLCLDPRE